MEGSHDDRSLRASDDDRERVAEVLRQAAGDGRLTFAELQDRLEALYAAKTYAELEPVISDLPSVRLPRPSASASSPVRPAGDRVAVPDRVGGVPVSRVAKAVFAGVTRRGQWVVPSDYRVKAVFGGAELDLREARLESHEISIEIKAVFGGVEVFLPDDVIAVVDGNGIFGGFADEASTRQPAPGAPVVRIGGRAVFGGVNVKRGASGASGADR
ncbi:MAG TPA: DUF1707 domain-containing protein [Jiangellaceae bacterium]|nr:DUF1707 domain-containing protein [Jiangellaceae bacterium]